MFLQNWNTGLFTILQMTKLQFIKKQEIEQVISSPDFAKTLIDEIAKGFKAFSNGHVQVRKILKK